MDTRPEAAPRSIRPFQAVPRGLEVTVVRTQECPGVPWRFGAHCALDAMIPR
jgi:hypothetical protein